MLHLQIYSFSYLKGQMLNDSSGNGGGFVFDCRALPNPGRLDEYKTLTGMDQAVVSYLEAQPKAHHFFNQVLALCSQSVEVYLEREFSHLMIGFGCTGGQHRSVFMAEKLTKYLADTYDDIVINLRHLQQEV